MMTRLRRGRAGVAVPEALADDGGTRPSRTHGALGRVSRIGALAIAAALSIPFASRARQLFDNPESVVFDPPGERYLVSNKGDGRIIEVDSTGHQRIFNATRHSCRGLCIAGRRLYAACDSGLAVMDLYTAETLTVIDLPGRKFPNDVAADPEGHLYVSDTGANRIFKVDPATGAVSNFVTHGLSAPNGVLWDASHHRLLVCSWIPRSPIQAVDPADSTVAVVIATRHDYLDGLTEDAKGRIYVSCAGEGTVYRYDPAWRSPPTVVAHGHASPADISINQRDHILAIPNFTANTVDFLPLETGP